MRKKSILLSLLLIPVAAFVFQLGFMKLVKADHAFNPTIHFVNGWLWGGSEDSSGIETGVGWGSASGSDTGSAVDYQLNIPFWDCTDCNVTGYAWHENIGWINFDPSGTFPASPDHSTKREGDRLTGWARVSGVAQEAAIGNSGGWEGWIRMEDVNLNDLNNSYAWNGEDASGGLGWISFENLVLPEVPQFEVCPDDQINIALSPEVAKNKGSADETYADIDGLYSETFFKYENCVDARKVQSNGEAQVVDKDASWNFSRTSGSEGLSGNDILDLVNNPDESSFNGKRVQSTGLADVEKGTTIDVTLEHNGLQDTVEVCVYDCSCRESTYFEDTDRCDCGCGVTVEAQRAHGEGWEETTL